MGIALLSLPENVYFRVQERKLWRIVEPLIQEEQYAFRPGCGTLYNLCTLSCLLGKAPKFTHSVDMNFADLERAYDRDSRGPLGDAAGVCGTRLFSACMNTVRAMVTRIKRFPCGCWTLPVLQCQGSLSNSALGYLNTQPRPGVCPTGGPWDCVFACRK